MTSAPSLREAVERVRERVAAAARRSGRGPEAVRIIGVTKGQPAEVVGAAVAAGLAHIGENRVQEAEAKVAALGDEARRASWHLVGHLQRNKVRPALAYFDVIHSVDSIALAERIDRLAQAPVRVLLEVNVAGEAAKQGVAPSQLPELVERARALERLDVVGLMTVAPLAEDAEAARPVFRELRRLAEMHGLAELSMGMTNDYEVAIAEGATMVRIGRALFGERA